ncbi:MAG: deoxyhypusine synthase family protein [Alphaproteobacteria bacterium]|nr:deoxyhypusine synthase family protein [Alphaproteobacteria bacterium]MCB9796002.1 deoxyhypusine synthase family protein [Alphaproteobacteria bacterium]
MSLESSFKSAPVAAPKPITGQESPAELLASAFPAYVGRQLRTAWELMHRCSTSEHTVFLTMSGAMTPAGLHRSCIIPMVQKGLVDVLTTTGANLYHDAHRVIGHAIREIDPNAGDTELREARIIRIYDLGFTEDVLLETDTLFERILRRPEFQRPLTTPRMHWLMGKAIHELEQELGVTEPCLLSACYQADVPIFVGAPQDGSIFLNVVKLRALLGDDFGFRLDAAQDVFEMAALQWQAQQAGDTAVWILGGGVPKNYTLQGEPTLSQILGLDARGFDVDVQFCVDPVDNGALSSCPAGEGHTWGKVSAECVQYSSIYVHADVTATVPWMVYGLMSEGCQRPLKRLFRALDGAVEALRADVLPNKASLLAD